jgi:hypothetical protein
MQLYIILDYAVLRTIQTTGVSRVTFAVALLLVLPTVANVSITLPLTITEKATLTSNHGYCSQCLSD